MAISVRILIQIILMIVFCRIKVCQWLHFYGNRTLILGSQYLNSLINDKHIGFIGIINPCSVLRTTVIPLSVEAGRVDCFKIQIE